MIRNFKWAISISFVIMFCSAAFGVPTLDQRQDTQDGGTAPMSTWKMAQTFTAGITGTLDHLEIGCSSTGATSWEIWDTTGGVPGSTVLGGVTVPDDMSTGWNTIDMSSQAISINAGTMYAIVTYFSPGGYEYLREQFDPDSYTGGQFFYNSGGGWTVITNYFGDSGDMQFRTYVETSTIPVPGTVLLAGIGTILVGFLRRHRTI